MTSASTKTASILYGASGNLCAFASDPIEHCTNPITRDGRTNLGELAHIEGDKEGSARYRASQPASERHAPANMILLCPYHHAMIDKDPHLDPHPFDVHKLKVLKERHRLAYEHRSPPAALSPEALAALTATANITIASAIAAAPNSIAVAVSASPHATVIGQQIIINNATAASPAAAVAHAPSSGAETQWWCRPYDKIWEDHSHCLVYHFDAGGMWGLFGGPIGPRDAMQPNYRWAYGGGGSEGTLALSEEQKYACLEALARAEPLDFTKPQHMDHAAILGEIAAVVNGSVADAAWIYGRTLRGEFADISEARFHAVVRALAPRYIESDTDIRGDRYRATALGLAASSQRARVWMFLTHTLDIIRQTYTADKKRLMESWRWSYVCAAGGYDVEDDFGFARNVMRTMKWSSNINDRRAKDFAWLVDASVEKLKNCRNLDHYWQRVSAGEFNRPWATAAVKMGFAG